MFLFDYRRRCKAQLSIVLLLTQLSLLASAQNERQFRIKASSLPRQFRRAGPASASRSAVARRSAWRKSA